MNTTHTFEDVLNENGSLLYPSTGASMLPLIREGRDLIYVQKRPEGRLRLYDAVLFRRPGVTGHGAYVLHRILKVLPDGSYWIVGDNCVSGETVREENILGVLTAVRRGKRTIRVSDLGYRAYVRLWCAPYRVRFFVLNCLRALRRAGGRLLRLLHLRGEL